MSLVSAVPLAAEAIDNIAIENYSASSQPVSLVSTVSGTSSLYCFQYLNRLLFLGRPWCLLCTGDAVYATLETLNYL